MILFFAQSCTRSMKRYHKGEEGVDKIKCRGCLNAPKNAWHALVKLSTLLDKQLIIITIDRNDHEKFDFQLPPS